MPLAQQMMLEDPVHCMHVVEHLQQHALFEIRQTVEVRRDDPVQAAVSPLLVVNEFRAVARCHDVTSFRLSMDIMRAIAHIGNSHFGAENMAHRPLTSPRKHASQARSRATVDALVEATARILIREGFDRASTNRIAEVAGVSIGSLYQYFPSKEALVAAVIDRHNQHIMQVVGAALTEVAAQPIEQAVRKMVATALEAHRIEPKLHRVLAEQIPRTGRLKHIEAFN